jgi:RNA polymerase sigma-70 factor (ECF subfamily)
MDDAARARIETELKSLCAQKDYEGAATLLVRSYGPELFGFLVALHGNEAEASDSFSDFTENLWRGLPRFAWESSARTWAYAIARNAMLVRRRNAARQRRRTATLGPSSLEGVAARVRSETLSFLRTETKTRLAAMRDSLAESDRMLLVLRLDRRLAWSDIARVAGPAGELSELALAKAAARLRKRYQLVKDRLREMAVREGLLREE